MNDKLYYFIVNPIAASGRAAVVWDNCKLYMDKHNIRYKAYLTSYAGQATEIAAELTKGGAEREPMTMVIIGGDGTIGETVSGINVAADVTIAPISAGSGNDFIRGNKLPKSGIRRLKQILRGKNVTRIDYGVITYFTGTEVKSRRFTVSSGMGYDAEICDGVAMGPLKKTMNRMRLGKLVYVVTAVKVLFTNKPSDVELILDGVKIVHLKNVRYIATQILPKEGGGIAMAPGASAEDGILDLCTVCAEKKLALVRILLGALFGGRHTKMKGVQMFSAKMAAFRPARPMTVHTDGDVLGELESFQIICEKGKIRAIL